MAIKDEFDNYIIVGRKKRFLKIFGLRINLDDIEQELNVNEFDCACLGNDEKITIFVQENINFEDLKNYIKKNFNIQSSGIKLTAVKKIPRTYSGKIDYSKLK